MITVLTVCAVTCVALIILVLVKPSVTVKGSTVSIYWIAPLLGAVTLICTGSVPFGSFLSELCSQSAINPIKILLLFISMTLLSVFLDEVGFFRYMASTVLEKSKSNQKTLFISLYLIVSVLTIFTSNDIIILTFTPFICYFAKNAKIDPIPYLFAEFVAANTWSMALVIGNPTNIYLSTAAGITFLEYTSKMLLPTVFACLASFAVLYAIFRKKLSLALNSVSEETPKFDKGLVAIGLAHLGACTLLLILSSYLNFEMWLITVIFAVSLVISAEIYLKIKHSSQTVIAHSFARAPWELVPFVLSMFVLVMALERCGVTHKLASFLGENAAVWKYGFASYISANLVNNIPMSVLFSSVISNASEAVREIAVYATVIGSNVAAFFTPIGALAGIMWSGILKNHGVRFSFLTYIKYGTVISLCALIAALTGLTMSI